MVADTAILVTVAVSLASGLLKEVSRKVVNVLSESSTVAGLKTAIFGGLGRELDCLEKELSKLEDVLCKAQCIDLMQYDKNNLALPWLRSINDAAFFADNVIDEIAYERTRKQVQERTSRLRKAVVPILLPVFRMQIARKVSQFMSMTAEIYKEADQTLKLAELVGKAPTYPPTTSTLSSGLRDLRESPDTSLVVGRWDDEELIVNQLCRPNNAHDLPVVAIVARSGTGKTTLARKVYDNVTVGDHFGKRIWIFVSDHFNLKRFLNEMLQSITGESPNLDNKCAMEEKLQQCLKEEKRGYLLVLDDVWNTDEQLWRSVESSLVRVTSSTRSRLLVTTQSCNVASVMRASLAHDLKDLDDSDAWQLFTEIAFANKSREQVLDLEHVGRRILSKCGGLPLAIKTMGSVLGSLNSKREWKSVERSEMWDLPLGSKIMPWLLLSFHHLPDAKIKDCFVHCSIIIEKGTHLLQSKLIEAWMAQGFIQATVESRTRMEDIGEAYIRSLVAVGLLQVDNRSDGCCCLWMHDLARFISKDTYFNSRGGYDIHDASRVEHLRICGENTGFGLYHHLKGKTLSKLRTLICNQATLYVEFVTQARFLRDLQLIDCGLDEVPSSIGGLKHLRYLSLRRNPLSCLPESIGTLLNLQTIDLEGCSDLVELPQAFTLLVNMRHILITRFVKMPKGMGQLTCLRTLPGFTLEDKEGLEIQELRSLPLLSGKIVITGLEHICCKEDAEEASLRTKAGITCLKFWWRYEQQRPYMDSNCDEEIMDGLHPHSNLTRISVQNFGGIRFSSWLPNMNNLKTVDLVSCYRCEQLPALGQLGSLEEISIHNMRSLRIIGTEFYHTNDGRRRILFPRLKTLRLGHMRKLRDWADPSGSTYVVFPCLEELEIKDCPSLVSAPTCFESLLSLSISQMKSGEPLMMILRNSGNLTALDIMGVEHLTSLSHPLSKCTSLQTVRISSCKELGELCPTLQCMASLERLEVTSCDGLTSFPNIEGLLSLHTLTIKNCKSLSTLQGLERCVFIEKLLVVNTKLDLIPNLTDLTRLKLLAVTHFSRQMWIPECLSHLINLRYLEIGAFSEEVDELRHLPKGLKRLCLYKWPKVVSLPSELQFFNQLESLSIEEFGEIERLPNWLGDLPSLQELSIHKCRKLKYFPPLGVMQSLARLKKFDISGCPLLSETCSMDGGEEWHKIAHLSNITIDTQIPERPT